MSLIAHSAKVLWRGGTEHILLLQYRYTPLRIRTFIWKIHFWKDMQRRVKTPVMSKIEDIHPSSSDFHEEVVGLLWKSCKDLHVKAVRCIGYISYMTRLQNR